MTFEQWAWGRGFSLPQMDVAKMAWEAALKAQAGEQEPAGWLDSDGRLYPRCDGNRPYGCTPLYTHPATERRVIPEDVRKVIEMALKALEGDYALFIDEGGAPEWTVEAIAALRNALSAAPAPSSQAVQQERGMQGPRPSTNGQQDARGGDAPAPAKGEV